ncbi:MULTISPECIES: M24 family metallopeptidase [Brevibacterium]|nr:MULTISPECIES: M24 family metallopeptidase [Brevibacterium]PCC48823.1 methionine aminopeptidase [Brevibacterium aurantiacum]
MDDYIQVQEIARRAMDLTRDALRPGMPLSLVRQTCEVALLELGADSFWYWGIGAFIFAGEGTTLSTSGCDYMTPDYVLGQDDLITLDLSPQRSGIWGDFARTLILEDGEPLQDARDTANQDWRAGVLTEYALHAELIEVAAPDMSFERLAEVMNMRIADRGYENLDFLGNLGHSIEKHSADRIYVEVGNLRRLDSVDLFTFEPHIRLPDGNFGFKHENIYRFTDGRLAAI